jgi:RimJ/RimL family protein N-acetyltransferase
MTRWQLDWTTPAGELCVREPTDAELEPHIPALVTAYNEPHNAQLLGHTSLLSADDVREHFAALREEGGRPLLLYVNGVLVGDADLRDPDDAACEFAFLIASPAAQGKGLGTQFATMIHAAAFADAALARIYASVLPTNVASLRVFEKLGYAIDTSEAARARGEDGDVILSVDRRTFLERHARAIAEIRCSL